MSKGRINNYYYLRYGLVVLIILAFIVATYFIAKGPKTSCEAQGKVKDPTPGHTGCLEPCKPDPKDYRCKTDKCKARWDQNKGVVCSDCDAGKIPKKEEDTDTYKCVKECNEKDKCEDGETCTPLYSDDTSSPFYCESNLYLCTKDEKDENRGHYCKKVEPGAGGRPLNECLKVGLDGGACSCAHDKGYALNNQNNACSTFACTQDGLKGWGSNQTDPLPAKYIDKDAVPVVNNTGIGTCYALDNEGLLLNPNDDSDKSKVCTNNTTQESCNDMNQEGWKCKWLPQVTCKQKPLTQKQYVDCCVGACNSSEKDGYNKWYTGSDKWGNGCKLFQFLCPPYPSYDLARCKNRGLDPPPPTNCLKNFHRSDDQIKYGDEILLSIDNTKANNGKLLKNSRLLFAYAKGGQGIQPSCYKKGQDQKQTFIGKYQGEGTQSLVSTNTVTFTIIPPTGVEPDTVLNTNDIFYLRSKYEDTGKPQSKYWYLTRENCGNAFPYPYCPPKPADETGYVSISEVSTSSDGGIVATAFRFVDPKEDDECGPNKQCDQKKTRLSYNTEYRLKNNEKDLSGNSTIPSYVGVQTCNVFQEGVIESLVLYGNPAKKTSWYIRRPENILEADCPNFFDYNGDPKSTDDIGGYNPVDTAPPGFHSKPLAQMYDISLFPIILAIVAILVFIFIIKKSHIS